MSIFVGNLPFRAEQEDVIELFAQFGEVTNCALPLERDTGRKRGFAFIEMADESLEDAAIEGLQGAELMGRPLRINKAEPRGSAPVVAAAAMAAAAVVTAVVAAAMAAAAVVIAAVVAAAMAAVVAVTAVVVMVATAAVVAVTAVVAAGIVPQAPVAGRTAAMALARAMVVVTAVMTMAAVVVVAPPVVVAEKAVRLLRLRRSGRLSSLRPRGRRP